MNSSDDDFSDHDSGVDLRDEPLLPDTEGMAKRTRLKKVNNGKQGASGGYAWEDEYQRTWDIVKNDEDGEQSLENLVQQMIESRKKKIMRNPATPFQRGIIRTLIVVIDGSLAMLEKDLRPTRFSAMLSYLLEFINEFFDQNPISQLGIVMMRNGMAHLVSEVSGLPLYHLDKLKNLRSRQHNRFEPKGDPSLQNALELSRSLLTSNFQGITSTSNKNSKEILIIFGALFTSDPGDIHKTIDALVKESIKVKVIGLSAQVAICQEIVRRTNFSTSPRGKLVAETGNFYGVIMNEAHFKELLMNCVEPLALTTNSVDASNGQTNGIPLIKMGFPLKLQSHSFTSNQTINSNFPQLCACHLSQTQDDSTDQVQQNQATDLQGSSSSAGYKCPQCNSKVCHLPTTCPVCGLMLILSTHLARSYHHLVPLAAFEEVPVSNEYQNRFCYGCLLKFPEGLASLAELTQTSSRYRCGRCRNDFCIDCDVFVHESLHNCPGCDSLAQ